MKRNVKQNNTTVDLQIDDDDDISTLSNFALSPTLPGSVCVFVHVRAEVPNNCASMEWNEMPVFIFNQWIFKVKHRVGNVIRACVCIRIKYMYKTSSHFKSPLNINQWNWFRHCKSHVMCDVCLMMIMMLFLCTQLQYFTNRAYTHSRSVYLRLCWLFLAWRFPNSKKIRKLIVLFNLEISNFLMDFRTSLMRAHC